MDAMKVVLHAQCLASARKIRIKTEIQFLLNQKKILFNFIRKKILLQVELKENVFAVKLEI